MTFDMFKATIKGISRALLEGFCANVVLPLTYLYIKLKEAVKSIGN